jgi:TolB-like protein
VVEEKPVNAPEPAKRERAATTKMKVAVLDFDSGAAQAKEADSRSKDIGKTASDLLGKKLDSSGYDVIDRKQVDKALQDQNLNNRRLDPAAASLGRSIGADTVIVGSVKPAAQEIQVNATAIDTQTSAKLATAQGGQAPGNGLAGAMDQVASSLGQQIQQKTRNRVEGYITAVNSKLLTLSVGARSGVKPATVSKSADSASSTAAYSSTRSKTPLRWDYSKATKRPGMATR